MSLSQEFAAILRDADALRAALAGAGIPQHCHEAYAALHGRLDAMALAVAQMVATPAKPDTK
jgi:hypothetical protein